MSDPFVGEIKIFAGNFAPKNWAFCDGSILAINSNQALASLLGNLYGGDGRTTFGLPDLRGRLPVHFGAGLGLTPRNIGERQGSESVVLDLDQITNHTHNIQASTETSTVANPAGQVLAKSATSSSALYAQPDPSKMANMPTDMIANAGGNQAHTNMMPYLCLNFIIALFGTYPTRNN